MDTRTGEIYNIKDVEKMEKAEQKHFQEIPDQFMGEIECMNRHERRKWMKLNRKRCRKILAQEARTQ